MPAQTTPAAGTERAAPAAPPQQREPIDAGNRHMFCASDTATISSVSPNRRIEASKVTRAVAIWAPAGPFDSRTLAAFKGVDVDEVFAYRDDVSLSFVPLVPLVMVTKYH
jgi:hypothetical protein